MKRFILSFTLLLTISSQAAVIYVNTAATGSGTGLNWTNAYTDLQDALAVATSADQIWVAQGTYKPAIIDREISFEIPNGVEVYGGFNGTETARSQRDWAKNPSILSGEVGFIQTPVDNSYAIVRIENTTDEVVLDGFVIRDAVRDTDSPTSYSALVIESSNCRIGHCIFTNNTGVNCAAVLVTGDSEVMLDNSLFHNNLTLSGGTVTQRAGNGAHNLSIIHCTLTDNNHTIPSLEVSLSGLTWEIRNSVLWGNNNVTEEILPTTVSGHDISDSVVEGLSVSADDVVDADPEFNNILSNDFRPALGTSVVDLGSISYSFSFRDLSGQERIVGDSPDAGCYEYKGQRILRVNPASLASEPDGSTWALAYARLTEVLDDAVGGDDLWVAKGIHYLSEDDDRTKSAVITGQVDVFGGFNGDENQLDERNWRNYQTIISGNIGDALSAEDNSYKLFYITPGSDCSIDGISLQNAVGNGPEDFYQKGAGVHVAADAECHIRNSIFRFLEAEHGGTAIEAEGTATVENCSFKGNGNAIGVAIENLINSSENLIVRGSAFLFNETTGPIINCSAETLQVNACTFYESFSGGNFFEMSNLSGNALVRNSIFSMLEVTEMELVDPSVPIEFSYSILNGFTLDESQIAQQVYFEDPYFLDEDNDDLRLCWASIGYNNGNSNGVIWGEDLLGINRLDFGDLDFGAYENELDRPVLRVNSYATGAETGLTWNDAFTDLNVALDMATCGTEVWIAEGVYVPDPINRVKRFEIQANTSVYGGFGGFEQERDQRDWSLYSTILSGEIGNSNTNTDNSYSIAALYNGVLDGVFLRDAYSTQGQSGSALYVGTGRQQISNVRFINNEGYIVSAMNVASDDCTVTNSLFAQNHTNGGFTVYLLTPSHINLINCTFSENTHDLAVVSEVGGALVSTATIGNCIFYGNDGALPVFQNPDYVVRNCLIEGGYVYGLNIIDANPLFVFPQSLNFRLSAPSPAVDAGNSAFVNSLFDIGRSFRIQGASVDLGCYEFADICPGDLNGDLVVNTGDLTIILSDFGCEVDCIYDITEDGVTNTADLQVILANFGSECGDG